MLYSLTITRALFGRRLSSDAAAAVNSRSLVDDAMENCRDLAHLFSENGELVRKDGLDSVGKRFLWIVMNFDKQAIRAYGYGSARKRKNFVALAGAMAGIDENRQMAAFFDGGNDSEVQRVARKIREGANAAF